MRKLLLLICLTGMPWLAKAQQETVFKPSDGLSNTNFYDIFQDSKGFVWIGTAMGLNKFDGHTFEVFSADPKDTSSLSSNLIKAIFEDSKGRIWVATAGGLQIFDRKLNSFINYPIYHRNKRVYASCGRIQEDKKGNLWVASSHGLIQINPANQCTFFRYKANKNGDLGVYTYNTLLVDKNDNIWIGTQENGLLLFNPRTNQSTTFTHDAQNPHSLPDNTVFALCQDRSGNLLIGTLNGGLSVYNPAKNQFATIAFSNKPGNVFNGGVQSIVQDRKGTIWVGTERNGLKMLDSTYQQLLDRNAYISTLDTRDSKVNCFEDKQGNLWLGVDYAGILLKKANLKPFHRLTKNTSDGRKISHQIVQSILIDNQRDLWVGTDGGGLNQIRYPDHTLKLYDKTNSALTDNAILALCEDQQHNLWVGTYISGMFSFDRKTGKFTNYPIQSLERGKNANFVNTIVLTVEGNLWVGTNEGGLLFFDAKTKQFTPQTTIASAQQTIQLPSSAITLLLDRENTLWIGSHNGLFCWNKTKGIAKEYSRKNGQLAYDDRIYAIYQDKKGAIWFGTNGGLRCIDQRRDTILSYTIREGLCSNAVYSIQEDARANLWVSTANGLAKFNTTDKTFRNYFTYDGLPGNEFRPNSSFQSSEGELYFGSTSGVVYFHPDSISENTEQPNLIFTQLKLFNEPVPVGPYRNGKTILTESIQEANQIHFDYSDNSFTLEFGAIDYNGPQKIKYAYKMEGFDANWIYTDDSRRYATYTNLSPGTYTFALKSTNRDGIWNTKAKTIAIRITPPFYKTWWAYLLYFILLGTLLYLVRRLIAYRMRMQQDLRMERLEREKIEEVNASKLQFFSNVSHEFRTPLTLIISPVEKLLSIEVNPSLKRQISIIHQNANRMLRLVNQLLDLQKVENNQVRLRAGQQDIIQFTKTTMQSFEDLAASKNIFFDFQSDQTQLDVWFDSDKLDKILFNLFSNAFKFTPDGGLVHVTIRQAELATGDDPTKQFVEITITDTGTGIDTAHVDKIFERFYQVENKDTSFQLGTGIGLHLTKSLVELHRGTIVVASNPGTGSLFTIRLPLGNSHLCPEELVEEVAPASTRLAPSAGAPEANSTSAITENGQAEKAHLPRILIMEDDLDIRTYLVSELSDFYHVLEASNGKEGLILAQETLPDLIVSDIMMPHMSGIEVVRRIKEDLDTSHIPVILLTARGSMEHKMEGIEMGADEYIPKPFHVEYLKLRIKKLIEIRESLKQKFSRTISFDAKEMTITSADEKFLQKAIDFVKENISNPHMSIEEMGQQIGISRVHLYRKLKSLTDQSPSEFIRTIRLKQGAYLLVHKKVSVSEVAYKVGFNSLQYFSNSFHDYFHMSPSEYVQLHAEDKVN